MNFATQIRRITDKLTYNHAYALDYPKEDGTNLELEEQAVRDWLANAISTVRREDVGDWLRLADQCIVEAFEQFRRANQNAGCRAIDSAIDFLRNATERKPFKVDFVARADGTVESAPED
jgi:hypothetical protein